MSSLRSVDMSLSSHHHPLCLPCLLKPLRLASPQARPVLMNHKAMFSGPHDCVLSRTLSRSPCEARNHEAAGRIVHTAMIQDLETATCTTLRTGSVTYLHFALCVKRAWCGDIENLRSSRQLALSLREHVVSVFRSSSGKA